MKHTINQEEQNQIKEAIEAFEKKSSAEIVTIITQQSDSYLFIPTLWAAMSALILPWIVYINLGTMSLQELSSWQLMSFVFLAFFMQIKPVKMFLVPHFVKKKRCAQAAQSHFLNLELHNTKKRAVVMLFVSEAEKYVEIISDVGVAQKVENSLWKEIVENFITRVKEGKIADGYLESIQKTGDILSKHFPYDKDEEDELPNHLIQV